MELSSNISYYEACWKKALEVKYTANYQLIKDPNCNIWCSRHYKVCRDSLKKMGFKLVKKEKADFILVNRNSYLKKLIHYRRQLLVPKDIHKELDFVLKNMDKLAHVPMENTLFGEMPVFTAIHILEGLRSSNVDKNDVNIWDVFNFVDLQKFSDKLEMATYLDSVKFFRNFSWKNVKTTYNRRIVINKLSILRNIYHNVHY